MGQIFSIRNFNAYIGRYSRRTTTHTPEWQTGWYLEDAIHEKLPILALRNREPDVNGPLAWRPGRNTRIAVTATLDTLSAWQAFRPQSARSLRPQLSSAVPRILESFQRKALAMHITSIDAGLNADWRTYERMLVAMAEAVGKLSVLKSAQPMLGSKIMHFLLPEFFPVWDTVWIKTALADEDDAIESLGRWMPAPVGSALSRREYAKPAIKYARYVALMMKDLGQTSARDYKAIERAYVRHSKVKEDVVWWHFYDLTPTLFEVCLLGKHNV